VRAAGSLTTLLPVWRRFIALAPGCKRTPSGAPALAVSKLTPANYVKITTGMTKAQVERIMGSPTTMDTKDMVIFKKTTYRYEEGSKFAVSIF
jgi:outer membrane protein assembly factor BamE (lipoprotein component of BamABCDE complex)